MLALALIVAGCARTPKLSLDATVDGGSELKWLAGDSSLAVALLGRGVAVVSAADGSEYAAWRMPTLPPHTAHGLAVSAGGETLAVVADDSVRVVRASDCTQLMATPGGGVSLALSGDGSEVAWNDGTLGRVIDTRDGHARWQGTMQADRNGLAWSPANGAFVWTDVRRVLFLGNPNASPTSGDSGAADAGLSGELGPFMDARPTQLAFSANGHTLAVAESTEYVSFWDVRALHMRWRLHLSGRARFERMALSADAHYLATTYEGRARILWAYSGAVVADWSPHAGAAVRDLAFSHDGRKLATIGANGRLRVWLVPVAGEERR
jgi:WD40 repeat protein